MTYCMRIILITKVNILNKGNIYWHITNARWMLWYIAIFHFPVGFKSLMLCNIFIWVDTTVINRSCISSMLMNLLWLAYMTFPFQQQKAVFKWRGEMIEEIWKNESSAGALIATNVYLAHYLGIIWGTGVCSHLVYFQPGIKPYVIILYLADLSRLHTISWPWSMVMVIIYLSKEKYETCK